MHLVDLKGPCCKPGCEDEEDESNRQRQLVGCPRVRSPSPSLLLPLFIQGSKEAAHLGQRVGRVRQQRRGQVVEERQQRAHLRWV
jgi:hypothetical protein